MHMMKQRRLGLHDPGLSLLDSEDLAPLLDLDFTQGRPYAHRLINKTAATATRASSANRYWLQPADDVGTNVLRYAQNSGQNRLNGLVIEGADQNVIIRNTYAAYQAGDWTIWNAAAMFLGTLSADAAVDLYGGGALKFVSGGVLVDHAYQTVALTAAKYIVCALVYTDGSAINDTVMGISAGVATGNPTQLLTGRYEHVGGGVYLVWDVITGTAANWKVGIWIAVGLTAYFSLLSCYLAAPANEGGDFPRSPIPNATAAAITRAADIYTHPGTNNYGVAAGTVDIAFVAPCAEADAAGWNMALSIYADSNNFLEMGYDITNDKMQVAHKSGGTTRAASGALSLARNDIVQLRGVYKGSSPYVILYGRKNYGAWSQLGTNTNALGGNLAAGMTMYIGRSGAGSQFHLGSFLRRIRIFNYAKVGLPGDF